MLLLPVTLPLDSFRESKILALPVVVAALERCRRESPAGDVAGSETHGDLGPAQALGQGGAGGIIGQRDQRRTLPHTRDPEGKRTEAAREGRRIIALSAGSG